MTPSNWTSAATRPEMDAGLQYHIRCKRGDVERYVLLPGDPERVDLIAADWDESRRIANYREHRTFSGKVGGVALTCCSTGAGGGSTASALEELAVLGGDTYIRVGTTAALQPEIECGDIVISSGAMRHDGTSQYYVDPAYPAVAHYAVTAALVEAAERLGLRYHVGVSCSTASFYCGQGRPGLQRLRAGVLPRQGGRPAARRRAQLRDGGGHDLHDGRPLQPPRGRRLHGGREPHHRSLRLRRHRAFREGGEHGRANPRRVGHAARCARASATGFRR